MNPSGRASTAAEGASQRVCGSRLVPLWWHYGTSGSILTDWWLKVPPSCVPTPGGLGQAAQLLSPGLLTCSEKESSTSFTGREDLVLTL